MTEQVLDVKGSIRLLRRSWRTIAVFVILGVVVAAAYSVVRLPGYHATSLVLLPGSESSGSSTNSSSAPTKNDITTDGRIATSAAVLVPAGREVDPGLSLSALASRVTAAAAATGVLRITASGSTAKEAEALSNAVANHLVSFVTTNGSGATATELAALQAEQTQLNAQIANAAKEIAAANQRLVTDGSSSPAGQRDSELVTQLTSQQSTLTLQLDSVKSQVAQAKLGQISANQGTEVIERATAASGPPVSSYLVKGAIGALVGLFLGSLFVLVRRRRDPRLWTRDELATAVGAPVLLSLDSPPRRTSREWAAFLEQYRPSAAERWNVRRALRELAVGDPGVTELVVIALAGDLGSLAQVARVALAGAGSGTSTLLAVVADDPATAGLEAACSRFAASGQGPRPDLVVRTGAPQPKEVADLVVIAVVVDPDAPVMPASRPPGARTVLSVSAGAASGETLARVAIAAADEGESIEGIFVANPGSGDQSAGRAGGSPSVVGRRRSPQPQPTASGWTR